MGTKEAVINSIEKLKLPICRFMDLSTYNDLAREQNKMINSLIKELKDSKSGER